MRICCSFEPGAEIVVMMSEFPPSLSLSRDVTFYLDTIRPFRWAASIIPCKERKVNILGKVLKRRKLRN